MTFLPRSPNTNAASTNVACFGFMSPSAQYVDPVSASPGGKPAWVRPADRAAVAVLGSLAAVPYGWYLAALLVLVALSLPLRLPGAVRSAGAATNFTFVEPLHY
jgi:hypothetical protein